MRIQPAWARGLVLGLGLCLSLGTGPAGAQTFTKITDGANPIVQFGVRVNQYGGASWVDADSDGDVDLFINGNAGIFRNNGGGSFTRFTVPFTNHTSSLGNTWADVDNDGDLDVFLSGGDPLGSFLYLNQGNFTFSQVTTGAIGNGLADKAWGCAFGDYDRDGHVDLVTAAANGFNGIANPNRLWHNNGDGTFARVDTSIVAQGLAPYTIPTWSDYDQDGDIDLFIGSGPAGAVARDFLYRNRNEAAAHWFQRINTAPLGTDLQDGQVYNWIDYDNDGDLDVYLTNYAGTTNGMANRLYRNNGGTFVAQTPAQAGPIVQDANLSLASVWQDFDNDGDLDCVVTNDGAAPTRFYRNEGNGSFTSLDLPGFTNGGAHYGATSGDYDGDGRMDMFVTGGPVSFGLFHNTTANGNGWLVIHLVGTVSNRAAIGARVRVLATIGGQPRWQMREVSAQNSFNGMNALDVHFGLADAAVADSIIVDWPSGLRNVRAGIASQSHIQIIENSTTPVIGSLVYATASAAGNAIEWSLPGWAGRDVIVQRAGADAMWSNHERVLVGHDGRAGLMDTDVHPGERYGYRLDLGGAAGSRFGGETWIEVPLVARFGFAGVWPNPGRRPAHFQFNLASRQPAELQFFNVAGRRVARVAVPAPVAGQHVLSVGATTELRSGVYMVRLRQGTRSDTVRVVVTD